MIDYAVSGADGWVLVAAGIICKIVINTGGVGPLRIHVGPSFPTMESPYFEIQDGNMFTKLTARNNVYIHAINNSVGSPATASVDSDVILYPGAVSGVIDSELRTEVGDPNSNYVEVFNNALT